MQTPFTPVPDWFPWENAGASIAVADVDADGRPDVVLLMVDAPPGRNAAFYRVGRALDDSGALTGGWTDWQPVPDWFSDENQGAGVAVADVNGNGALDLVVFLLDAPDGPNLGWFRVGWSLDPASGTVTGGWTGLAADPRLVPLGERRRRHHGRGRRRRRPARPGRAHGRRRPTARTPRYYRSGPLDADGTVTALAALAGRCRTGRSGRTRAPGSPSPTSTATGTPSSWSSRSTTRPGRTRRSTASAGGSTGAAGRATAGGRGRRSRTGTSGRTRAAGSRSRRWARRASRTSSCSPSTPRSGQNAGFQRVLDAMTDLEMAPQMGVWRLLEDGSGTLAVHAALLHTGDRAVLRRLQQRPGPAQRPPVRHDGVALPRRRASSGPTRPVDLFCCGHAFLPDGRLLAAGGTQQYDPFFGLTPVDRVRPGADRPTRRARRHGRSLDATRHGAAAGTRRCSRWATAACSPSPAWTRPASSTSFRRSTPTARAGRALPPSPHWPLYGHLFLLADGRVFYSGGQYGDNNGVRPARLGPRDERHHRRPRPARPRQPQPVRQRAAAPRAGPAGDDHRRRPVRHARPDGRDGHDRGRRPRPPPPPAYARAADLHMAPHAPVRDAAARPHRAGQRRRDDGGDAPRRRRSAPRSTTRTGGGRGDGGRQSGCRGSTTRWPLLMPDGKVVTAGSNPQRKTEEMRVEVFWPPYLFAGARPSVAPAQQEVTYGAVLTVDGAGRGRGRERRADAARAPPRTPATWSSGWSTCR